MFQHWPEGQNKPGGCRKCSVVKHRFNLFDGKWNLNTVINCQTIANTWRV